MKQQDFNQSYVSERPDIEALLCKNQKVILDVGCSTGTLGAAIKAKTGAMVIGIEFSKEMAAVAANRIDKVFQGEATEIICGDELADYRFSTIIFGDVLEHLVDPWTTLASAVKYLEPNGHVIASIPNVRHIDTVINLIFKGYWPYRNRGIHDKTHLRFFTKKNISELFSSAGLSIEVLKGNYRLIEAPHILNDFAKFLAIPGLRDFITFQYLVRGQHKKVMPV
jgi:2-polyprenyl-3-methyl-5-hydroxy-6-metoxy-1,4-benzoquinol methylase